MNRFQGLRHRRRIWWQRLLPGTERKPLDRIRRSIGRGIEMLERRELLTISAPWGNLLPLAAPWSMPVYTASATADNTMAGATSLGTLSGTKTINDSVSRNDRDDYFSFTLASGGQFSLSLTGLRADADVRLIQDRNGNKRVDAGEVIAISENNGTANESIVKSLDAGSYFVDVYRYRGDTNYTLTLVPPAGGSTPVTPTPVNPSPPSTPTFLNMKDAALASLTQSLDADGAISRNDMIQILTSAGADDGVVDANELGDLKTILGNAATLKMPGYVQVLTSDVVNGNLANAHYQGQALGNLAAGSSATQLNKLINKWFKGTDHPDSGGYAYQTVSGSLFTVTPSHLDEYQGYLGDCYFISAIGAIADSSPAAVKNMFVDNQDGTWTVRFYANGVADYVTVDAKLPVYGGSLVYAGLGVNGSLWVALAEKAYAQWNETGKEGRDGSNSYAGIEGGWMADVDVQVLGHSAASYNVSTTADQNALIAAMNKKLAVTIGTVPSNRADGTLSYGLYGSHAYAVVAYNSATGQFTLYNPWGEYQPSLLTWAQLKATCDGFVVADPAGSVAIATSVLAPAAPPSRVIAPRVALDPATVDLLMRGE